MSSFIGPSPTLNFVAKRTPSARTAETTARLGQWIQKAREERNWTQEKLAEVSGLSRNHIQNLENNRNNSPNKGTANPSLDTLFALEDAFQLELGELLVRVRKETRPPKP